MFQSDNKIVGGSGTRFTGSIDILKAYIDCPGNPGYLTYKGPLDDTAAYCRQIVIEMFK